MATTYTQDNTYLTVTTPLGADVLMLTSMHGEEGMSSLFYFDLEMVSTDAGLDFSQIVGKSVTVSLSLDDSTARCINGVVTRFVQTGGNLNFATYHAEMRPWLWWLTLRTDSRIFQEKTTPDIIKAVFSDLGFTDYRVATSATYTAREYCVQYQESAFDFISRLMEEDGIFYFFEHEDGKHTLVLADAPRRTPHVPTSPRRAFIPRQAARTNSTSSTDGPSSSRRCRRRFPRKTSISRHPVLSCLPKKRAVRAAWRSMNIPVATRQRAPETA